VANILRNIILLTALILAPAAVFSQSHSLDGQIEGFVYDPKEAAISGATVTATNTATGFVRSLVTNDSGFYRMPLMPPGTYRLTVDAPTFMRTVRDGITLGAGQTATIDFTVSPGVVVDSVTVTADTAVADPGKTDLSRVMNSREVQNIPLPTRNPLNFAILQANVTGRPNRGFNFPQVNVNGFIRRINYLLDGNTNMRSDGAGSRLMMMSEVFVNEVQIVTNGFAPEFGNTTGMIMNIVTPAGTNDIKGKAGYLFRRPSFYARPFFFSAAQLPHNSTNNVLTTVSGPIIRDRWHWYAGYEYIDRDDSTRSNRQVTISETNRTALIAAGLPASIFVPAIPSKEKAVHLIFRTDVQLGANNNLMARFNRSHVATANNISGDLNTLERSVDISTPDRSLGLQLVSARSSLLNEFRFQYARRDSRTDLNASSGSGPSISIPQVANFGSPTGTGSTSLIQVAQAQDNVTWTRGPHAIKFGGGVHFTTDKSISSLSSIYTFPTIEAYLQARSGSAPYGYSRYEETFGDPRTAYSTTFWHLFAQDDWKATRRLKLNFGLRYDLYLAPGADPSSPLEASRKFNVPKTSVSPRLGLAYSLRGGTRPLVFRAGAGIYFEPPFSEVYNRALLENGAPRFFRLRFCGTAGGLCPFEPLAPAFPGRFSGSPTPARPDVVTVSPEFENMYAIHSNLQIEQALTGDMSVAFGYVHAGGRHIPVYRSINPINPIRNLADGRPVFDPNPSAATRLYPEFNFVQIAESVGVSRYDALSVKLTQRQSRGLQFMAAYTLSKATDDAPEQNVPYMLGGGAGTLFVSSDPRNRSLDRGYSYGDQRHTFVMSMVARPMFEIANRTLRRVLNDNQFGIIAMANSGERFSIGAGRLSGGNLSPLDLNLDGISFSDRPVGIKRNSGKTPPQFTLDLRYSRFFDFTDRYRLELFGEVQNLFNINTIVAYVNLLVPTNETTGEMMGPLPDFKARGASTSIESRQAQIGIKLHF